MLAHSGRHWFNMMMSQQRKLNVAAYTVATTKKQRLMNVCLAQFLLMHPQKGAIHGG